MEWSDLIAALGLAAAIEGSLYALAPEAMKKALAEFFMLPTDLRRLIGLAVAIGGVALVWIARS